jgi:ATP-dependent Clp protease adapter protein ClpS
MIARILSFFLLVTALVATTAFVPANARSRSLAFSSRTSSGTTLFESPAILDKPATKEEIKISKDAEKESTPSNSKGWAVRLYNDPMNKREFVARCLTEVCSLSDGAAYQCMMRAHQFGISVIGEYHLEMAELYRDQLTEQGLLIDMVPVDDDK